jgi:hypothetical protein
MLRMMGVGGEQKTMNSTRHSENIFWALGHIISGQ